MKFPPWERLEVTDLSTLHPKKQEASKETLLHFTAPESPALEQRRRQVFSTHYPWESPSWHPFNMGSPLLEWRPQPLGAPDTPLPRHAASALTTTLWQALTGWIRGLVRGEWARVLGLSWLLLKGWQVGRGQLNTSEVLKNAAMK